MLMNSREHDLRMIEAELRKPGIPEHLRTKLKYQAEVIKKEQYNPKIRSMRQALEKAYQRGDKDEIDNIREWAEHNPAYRNDN